MLPDFPVIKLELNRESEIIIQVLVEKVDPLLSQIRIVKQHEGDIHSYASEDGNVRSNKYKEISSLVRFNKKDMPNITINEIYEKIKELAQDMRKKTTRIMFDEIEAVTKESGTNISADGQPLTFDLYYKMIDELQVDFDEDTKKPTFQIVVHPSMVKKLIKLNEEWNQNPEYLARMKAQMERKYKEWYEREINRKLVD